jgi:hypothetical protein
VASAQDFELRFQPRLWYDRTSFPIALSPEREQGDASRTAEESAVVIDSNDGAPSASLPEVHNRGTIHQVGTARVATVSH